MLSLAGVNPKEPMERKQWEKLLEERFNGKMVHYGERYGRLERISVWYTKGSDKELTVIFCINGERLELPFREFINDLELL